MHVGLIGGIGPAATDFYYRRLIAAFAARAEPLDLTIVHADAPTLLANLAAGAVGDQVAIYARITDRLAAAGADFVVITSIAGHFCVDAFAAVSPLPIVNMITTIADAITARGLARIGILGTRTVMETRLYGAITNAEVIAPRGRVLDDVHAAYAAMATSGMVTNAQRAVFHAAAEALLAQDQVDAIMLGGTDLALAFDAATTPFPLVDCAGIHVEAIVDRAIA
jgi:aspartate racemase